ncbi:hypothetical protein V6N12_036890 [Hibiscus sabdariffa]|uniref:Uncharacterized protein n=1 Tax=Hibiscus sabdariffa TaxID=183260 RepID=A0ABR2BUZ7_9ROSI
MVPKPSGKVPKPWAEFSVRIGRFRNLDPSLLDKPPRESLEILDKLTQNEYQHPTSQRGIMKRGLTQLDSSDTILA